MLFTSTVTCLGTSYWTGIWLTSLWSESAVIMCEEEEAALAAARVTRSGHASNLTRSPPSLARPHSAGLRSSRLTNIATLK